jgi:hypothetical protein
VVEVTYPIAKKRLAWISVVCPWTCSDGEKTTPPSGLPTGSRRNRCRTSLGIMSNSRKSMVLQVVLAVIVDVMREGEASLLVRYSY